MPTPQGLNTTTIHMEFVEPNATGTPLQGSLTFTPNPSPILFPNENIIVAGTETATLDVNGEATIELISTDQAGENPTGWLYTVTEKIIGQRQRTYNIALPYNAGVTVELADITPTEVAPTYIPVVGPQGAPGVITSVNGYSTSSVTLAASDVGAIATSEKGAANGVATLDATTKVPVAQVPDLSSTYVAVTRIGAASGVASLDGSTKIPSAQLSLASSAPPAVGTGAVGTSTLLARQDHTHSGVDLTTGQSIAGVKNFTSGLQTAQLGVGVAPGGETAHIKSTVDEIILFVEQTASSPTNSIVLVQTTGASNVAYGAYVAGDSANRISVSAAGTVSWGPGSGAADVTLSRTAVGELTVGGQIISNQAAPTASGHLTRKDYVDNNFTSLTGTQTISGVKTFSSAPIAQAASAGTVVFNARVTGDTVSRLTIGADGALSWGPGGSTATDFVLSRANTIGLNFTGTYQSTRSATSGVGFATLVTGDTVDRYRIYADGLNEWGPGGSTARDTNLYRSAANTLKTDDALVVVGNLTAPNVATARATGSETFVFSASSSVDVNVTFPAGRFSSTPRVVAVLTSLPSNSSALIIRASSITSTGMTLRCNDVAGTARTLTITADWFAEQG